MAPRARSPWRRHWCARADACQRKCIACGTLPCLLRAQLIGVFALPSQVYNCVKSVPNLYSSGLTALDRISVLEADGKALKDNISYLYKAIEDLQAKCSKMSSEPPATIVGEKRARITHVPDAS